MEKYKACITKSDDEVNAEDVTNAVEQGKLQLQSDVLATKNEVKRAQTTLTSAMRMRPFNSTAIIWSTKSFAPR